MPRGWAQVVLARCKRGGSVDPVGVALMKINMRELPRDVLPRYAKSRDIADVMAGSRYCLLHMPITKLGNNWTKANETDDAMHVR